MSKIKIVCTSTGCIEYAPERYRNLGIDIIRVHFIYKGKEYLEGLDLDPDFMYKEMTKVKEIKGNLPYTAMPTYEEVAAVFEKAIKEGCDELIAICIDSYLGGTYNFITQVAKDYQDKIKIHTVDALITCWPEGYMAVKAKEWADEGMDSQTILKELEWMKKHHEFIGVCTDLNYMILNGRLKGGKAYLGKMMSICPVLHIAHNGELCAVKNVMGVNSALKQTMQMAAKIIGDRNPKDYVLSRLYTGPTPLDRLIVMEEKTKIVAPNHENVIMSPVSGCHVGPYVAGYCIDFIRRPDEPLD